MSIPLGGPPAGRVAIVTGGSRGVGWATIRLLAALGCAVAPEARRPNPSWVADVIAFLLSDQGEHITGQVLRAG